MKYRYKLTVYDDDGSTTYETNNANEIIKQLESIKEDETEQKIETKEVEKEYVKPLTPYERCRNSVYATGNRWAIENFNATH